MHEFTHDVGAVVDAAQQYRLVAERDSGSREFVAGFGGFGCNFVGMIKVRIEPDGMVLFNHFAKLIRDALRHNHRHACTETNDFDVRYFAQAPEDIFYAVVTHQQCVSAGKQHVPYFRGSGNIIDAVLDTFGGCAGIFLSGKAAACAVPAIHGAHIGDEKEYTVGISVRESGYGRVAVFVQGIVEVSPGDVQFVDGWNGLLADGAIRVFRVYQAQVIGRDSHPQCF